MSSASTGRTDPCDADGVCVGHYLDLAGAAAADPLAGADERLRPTCEAYGRPLGKAFQLRDELLGVFGDPVVTGKSALEAFREGKATVLMALTQEREVVGRLHGNPRLDETGAPEPTPRSRS